MQKEIISALIGLIGATGNNGTTETTDDIIKNSIILLFDDELDSESIITIVDAIHMEKFKVSPSCATCAHPCGNTSDYDFLRFFENDKATQENKIELLQTASNYVVEHAYAMEKLPEEIKTAIAFFGYDLADEAYQKLIEKINLL